MNIKTKKYSLIFHVLLACVISISFGINAQKVLADTCSTQNTGFMCVDTAKVTGTSGCKTGLCGGGNSVQCCSVANVKCKTDGSSLMQPCSTSGGQCNALGDCVNSGTPAPTSQGTNFGPSGSTNFTNPLGFKTVEEFLGGILSAIQRIIVVLALVFIMIGAVMYVVSAGDKAMIDKAKGSITMALIGLALGVAAPSLLKELATIIGWGGAGAVAGALTLTQIAMNVLKFLLGTMGIVALVMMVLGAIMYLTSAGDSDRISKGKDIFKYSVIGVLLAMSAMVLVTQIAKFFQ
jgi:hypothetical protein